MLKVGEIIKAARLEAGISQASLARRAGTSQAAISRIERGLEDITLGRFSRILTSLGLRPRIELEPLADHGMSPCGDSQGGANVSQRTVASGPRDQCPE